MNRTRYKVAASSKLTLSKQRMWLGVSLILPLVLAVASCGPDPGEKMVPLLPNGRADLLIIYKKGVTNEQIEYFLNNVLAHPSPDGRGYELLPSIGFVGREKAISGYEATDIAYHS